MMQRAFSLLLAVLTLALFMPGCGTNIQRESEPVPKADTSSQENGDIPVLRILIDLTIGEDTSSKCADVELFLTSHVEGCGTDFTVEVEALPTISEPDKRNPLLTGLHMELMTGGPDLFIMRNFANDMGLYTDLKNFFPYPTSAMRQRLFLPLDEYIERDDNADWGRLQPTLLEAGKLDGSQQIVPLSYSITAALVDCDKYTPSETFPMDWQQMLNSSDPVIQQASYNQIDMLGVLADYSKEELAFSEEDLLKYLQKIHEIRQSLDYTELDTWGMQQSIMLCPLNDSILYADEESNFWMIPTYNQKGGVTARVDTFAAISRNTEYPEEAYSILRALISKEYQQTGIGFRLPVYTGLGQDGASIGGGWYLDEWDYHQLKSLQEQINAVEFTTPLSNEMESLFRECSRMDDETELQEAVHDAYARMRMMLAES